MKLKDITEMKSPKPTGTPNLLTSTGGRVAQRNTSHPELPELLNARNDNKLFSCILLAPDELELATFIIDKLDNDPDYIPSMLVLDAVRSINVKVALGRNLPLK
jgi:hypothetical protein